MSLLVATSRATIAPVMLQGNYYFDNTTECSGTETPMGVWQTERCVRAGTVGGVPFYKTVSNRQTIHCVSDYCSHPQFPPPFLPWIPR